MVILDTILEAEPRLQLPTGATRLSNGSIVVSDRWAQAVRFFDESGALVRTAGRGGEGPGEFTAPSWLGQCGPDQVFVWDYMQNQMAVIDSAGTVVREFTPHGNPAWFRCSSGGRIAIAGQTLELPRSVSQVLATRFTARLWLANADGDSVGGVGVLPMAEGWILGKQTQYAITDDRLYVGTADSAFLDVYDLGGVHISAIPLAITPRPPSEANIQAWLDKQWEVFQDTQYREQGKQMTRQRSKVPEHLPLYTGLALDPEGVIWVVLSSPGDAETRFQAVSKDGTFLADLRIPEELELYEVGRDYLLGGIHHETGIPGIALYRIHRGLP
ncbi:MAG: hypothetical protein ACYC6F_17615 [Longimicrobiales bacterium]